MHTQDHILQGVCVRDALMNRGWVWTRRPRSPHPTLEMLHPSDGAPLRGWEHGGLPRSTAGSPLRPSPFHLPVSSGFPTTNHWQRKRGKKHRRREKGKFWPWGGGACAFPATGQPGLFIQVWLVCSRATCQHNPFFPALTRGYGCETEAVFTCTSKHNSLYFISDPFRCKQWHWPGRGCWNFLIFQRKNKKNGGPVWWWYSSWLALMSLCWLWEWGGREDGNEREKKGEGVFTEMSCGRCWTMTGTKERFEHCTSKNPFPFLFCVSPASSTTESFFLSLLPLLIAARRIPCSFFSSPLCSPCLPHRLPVSPSVSLFLPFNVPPPHPSPLSALSSPSSFSPWLGIPFAMRHVDFWGGSKSSRTQWLNFR